MLTDAELTQMLADAERIQALREKATPGPWKKTQVAAKNGGHNALVMGDSHSIMEVFGWHDDDNAANADLTVATRTDPSAANVLRLVEEVRQLRNMLRPNINNPEDDPLFYDADCIEQHVHPARRHKAASDIIDACHIHSVPVPEHLKAYEEGGAT